MEAIKQFQRRYCGGALTAAILIGLGVYMAGWPAVTRGILLGSLFSCFNFALLGQSLTRKLTDNHRRGTLLTLAAQLGRYLLWGVPVVVAVKWPAVDLPSTVAGLFMVPACIVLDSVFSFVRGTKSPFA
jgi:hypothetical protein